MAFAFTTAGLKAGVDGIATAGAYISAHTGDPSTTRANEVTGVSYSREETTWGAASNGSRVGSQVTLDIPASTTVTHWGVWSAATGGTFLGGGDLADPEPFGAAGEMKHTPTLVVANPAP